MSCTNAVGVSAPAAPERSATQSKRRGLLTAAIAAAVPMLVCGTAGAATFTWDGETDGVWETATNWVGDAVPAKGGGDDIIFAAPAATNLTIALTPGAAADETRVQSLTFNAGLTGNVTVNGHNNQRLRVDGRTGDDIVVLGGSHTIGFSDPAPGNASPNVQLRHGGNFNIDVAAGASLDLNGRLGSTSSGNQVSKSGDGLLILSANNGGSSGWNVSGAGGLFSVNGGTLRLSNGGATGNSANRFTVNTGGTLELAANYGATGGALTLAGGTLTTSGATRTIATGTGTVALVGNSFMNLANALNLEQDLSGSGNLTKSGSGTLNIRAVDNTHTGTITIAGGGVSIAAAANVSSTRAFNIQNGARLVTDLVVGGYNIAANQTVQGSGRVVGSINTASGTLAGGTVGTAGTLTVGDGGTTASNLTLSGGRLHFDLAAAQTPGGGVNDLIVVDSGVLAGSGNITATAPTLLSINRLDGVLTAGTYQLATFTGTLDPSVVANLVLPTMRQSLALDTSVANQLNLTVGPGGSASLTWAGDGAGNVWDANGAQNWLNAGSPDEFFDGDAVTFTGAGSSTPDVNITEAVSPDAITVDNASYAFTGTGKLLDVGSLTKSGTGTLTLANADGNTIEAVAVDGGTLRVQNANNFGTVNVNAGGVLTYANANAGTAAAQNVAAGGTLNIGDGATAGVGNAGGSITNAGAVVYNRPDDFTSTTVISGAGSVEKKGAGIATVNALNTYTGDTLISAGTLKTGNSSALGAPGVGTVTVADGATLDVGGAADNAINFGQKQFRITGNGVNGTLGAIYNGSALRQFNSLQRVALDGNASISGAEANSRIDIRGTNTGGVNSGSLALDGKTLTKNGPAQFSLVATDVDSGNIVVNGGVFAIESTSVVPAAAGSAITMNDGTTLQFFNNAAAVSTVTRQVNTFGNVTVGNASSGTQPSTIGSPITMNGNLTFDIVNNGAGNLTMTGNITEAGGARSVSKVRSNATHTSTNTVTLTGALGWTGDTTVSHGTLALGNSLLGTNATSVSAGATLAVLPAGDRMLGTKSLALAGKLDLADNDLIVDYTGASVESQVRQYVKDGRVVGATAGIFSTPGSPDDDKVLAVADNAAWGKSAFNGINIDTDTVVGKYTYFGDANLDGKVTGDDYVSVDANLGTGDSWLEGDFNMNGVTTGDDYVAIDANLGKGTPTPLAFAELKEEMVALHVAMFGEEYLVLLAQAEAEGFGASVVPEPTAISLIGLGAVGLLGRRRRSR